MTKKQRKRLQSLSNLHSVGMKMMNENPVRYANYQDAESNQNPIRSGEPGYEDALYEQRFVPLKS